MNFTDLSEKLFTDWKNSRLPNHAFRKDLFIYEALPEPYLLFGVPDNPICFLTTNPGGVLDFQKRGNTFHHDAIQYKLLAQKLAEYYSSELKGPAKVRIKRMLQVADYLNKEGVIQFEMIPYHSANLPKQKVPSICESDSYLKTYHKALLEELQGQITLTV